jgi:hypothetical protein
MKRPSFRASLVLATLATVTLLASAARAEEPPPATKKGTATPSVVPAPLTRVELAELIVKARYGETFTFPPEPYFTDVPAGDPRFKYVQKFRADKLTMGQGLFGATLTATRYMLVTFLVRARFGESFDYPEKALFKDVPESHGNFKYVQKAAAAGLVSGCEKDAFCPEQAVYPAEARKVVEAAFPKNK